MEKENAMEQKTNNPSTELPRKKIKAVEAIEKNVPIEEVDVSGWTNEDFDYFFDTMLSRSGANITDQPIRGLSCNLTVTFVNNKNQKENL